MALSVQTVNALDQQFGHGPAGELQTAINNAVPNAAPTFGAITGTSLNVGAGALTAGAASLGAITGSSSAQIAGNLDTNGAAGGAASNTTITKTITVTDNVAATLLTISIPNVLAGALVKVTVMGMLGDGDSTDSKIYLIAVSRVAGAAAKAVAGTAIGTGATAGVSGNSVVTVAVPSVSGAVGATNTFAVTGKVARSAGAADNHIIVAKIEVLNASAGGVTVA